MTDVAKFEDIRIDRKSIVAILEINPVEYNLKEEYHSLVIFGFDKIHHLRMTADEAEAIWLGRN